MGSQSRNLMPGAQAGELRRWPAISSAMGYDGFGTHSHMEGKAKATCSRVLVLVLSHCGLCRSDGSPGSEEEPEDKEAVMLMVVMVVEVGMSVLAHEPPWKWKLQRCQVVNGVLRGQEGRSELLMSTQLQVKLLISPICFPTSFYKPTCCQGHLSTSIWTQEEQPDKRKQTEQKFTLQKNTTLITICNYSVLSTCRFHINFLHQPVPNFILFYLEFLNIICSFGERTLIVMISRALEIRKVYMPQMHNLDLPLLIISTSALLGLTFFSK